MSEEKTECKAKRTRVNVVRNVTTEMCIALPNVTYSAGEAVAPIPNTAMREILYNAALHNRGWQFVVVHAKGDFKIKHGDEELGSVSLKYSRRVGEYIPYLEADRLGTNRRGDNAYSNKDAAPILRKIREHVFPRTDEEIMAARLKSMRHAFSTAKYEMANHIETLREALSKAAVQFAMDPQFLAAFVEFGKVHGNGTDKKLEEIKALEANKLLTTQLGSAAGTACAIVVPSDSGWYVQHNDVIAKFTEDALPEKYSNVHALKMVNAGVAIPELGVKLGDGTFVVFVQEE